MDIAGRLKASVCNRHDQQYQKQQHNMLHFAEALVQSEKLPPSMEFKSMKPSRGNRGTAMIA
jgi:hypothetical protein